MRDSCQTEGVIRRKRRTLKGTAGRGQRRWTVLLAVHQSSPSYFRLRISRCEPSVRIQRVGLSLRGLRGTHQGEPGARAVARQENWQTPSCKTGISVDRWLRIPCDVGQGKPRKGSLRRLLLARLPTRLASPVFAWSDGRAAGYLYGSGFGQTHGVCLRPTEPGWARPRWYGTGVDEIRFDTWSRDHVPNFRCLRVGLRLTMTEGPPRLLFLVHTFYIRTSCGLVGKPPAPVFLQVLWDDPTSIL